MDEADQLARPGDLGPQVNDILELCGCCKSTHFSLLSATYPDRARDYFYKWAGTKHVLVQVDKQIQEQFGASAAKRRKEDDVATSSDEQPPSTAASFGKIPSHIEQILHVCSVHKKPKKLIHTLSNLRKNKAKQGAVSLGIVFFAKIEKLKYVASLLRKEQVECLELHSQLPTPVRQANLKRFSTGQVPLLLATDIAARGIDISSLNFVIQYDFPGNLPQYIHRCGRAGRNGEPAQVFSFFTRNLCAMAPDMIKLLEASGARVDPNLRSLAADLSGNAGNDKKPKPLKSCAKKSAILPPSQEDDGDEFPELSINRIVLKRASHVSDASSSSSEEDEND